MATKAIRPVTRESFALVRERGLRPLLATIDHSTLVLRPKGLRREEFIDLAACYSMAVKMRIARERAERRAARKAKGKR